MYVLDDFYIFADFSRKIKCLIWKLRANSTSLRPVSPNLFFAIAPSLKLVGVVVSGTFPTLNMADKRL
ncbi:hypothetical protein, partial [Azospirillum brasilense]|uniref:hypothetical protein n=1 Tax=Azospirillum brasilense TaxID=192 RepID=UPI001B3BB1AA